MPQRIYPRLLLGFLFFVSFRSQEWQIAVYLLAATGAFFVVGAICLCFRRRLEKQGNANVRKAAVEFGGECAKSSSNLFK